MFPSNAWCTVHVPKSTVAWQPLLRPCSAVPLHTPFHYYQPTLASYTHTHGRSPRHAPFKSFSGAKQDVRQECSGNVLSISVCGHRGRTSSGCWQPPAAGAHPPRPPPPPPPPPREPLKSWRTKPNSRPWATWADRAC